jgi:uncharacterized lipoprotein YddW (UPF0748 family)
MSTVPNPSQSGTSRQASGLRGEPVLTRRAAVSALARTAAGLTVAASLPGCTGPLHATVIRDLDPGPPLLDREFRALWVAHVDNIDWPSAPGLTTWRQQHEMRKILDAAVACRLNAIILQVRPTADAIYPSRHAPWSAFLTGTQGRGPDPDYDPLQAWIDAAHERGLDLHAWINPFRVRHPKSIGRDARDHLAQTHPELVRTVGSYLWLDPGEPDSRRIAMQSAIELLDRYNVDGLHLDDYFYPYPEPGAEFPDADTHRRYGGGRAIGDWRRANIDAFVVQLRDTVRASGRSHLFTISPFGIWRPDHPAGVRGLDAYAQLHADSRGWLRDGLVDALMPQLYWPIDSPGQPFEPLLTWWHEQNTADRHLWPGLFLTRVRPSDEAKSWPAEEIVRQITLTRTAPGARTTGAVLYSAVGLLNDHRGVATRLAKDVYHSDAIVPESPWLAGTTPERPRARMSGNNTMQVSTRGHDARRWAVSREGLDGVWTSVIHPGSKGEVPIPSGRGPVWVRAVHGNGRASEAVRV